MRRALRLSFIEGLFSTVTVSLVDPFIVPAVLALRAGNLAVALISGTGLLLSGLTHFLTPSLAAGVSSRRVLVIRCVRVQAGACLLLAGAGFFGGWALALAIAAYALYCSAGSVSYGLWASWMGDLVPSSGRSRYYALRSMVYGPVGGAVMLGMGLLFRSLWGAGTAPWQAFAMLFLAAGSLRIVSSLVLRGQHEPAVRGEQTPTSDFTYWQFLRRAREGNFAAFAILFALLNGGSVLTGPFFGTFVLRDLRCGYVTYVMFSICSIASSMIFVHFWARVADRWGQMLVIRICALLLSFIPLLYLGDGSIWPLLLGWVAGGMVWSGLNLASFNLVTETATPRRRVRCYAYLQATVGIVVAAYMFGFGALADHLPRLFRHQIQTIFLFSVVLRLLPALGLIFLVKERVLRPPASVRALIAELPAVRPAMEILRELMRPFSKSQG